MTKTKTSETRIAKRNDEQSVSEFISQAISQKLPVETMEKLFALREKVKAEQAREEFVKSLSAFQAECPVIKKTKKVLNKDGRTVRYQYAPLDAIVEQIKKPLAKHELSYTWDVEHKEADGLTKEIKAIAKVTHVLGHSETSVFTVPIDTEGYMTKPQQYASALTFAKRYALCDALGISTGDEDTDAVDVGEEKDAQSVKSKIIFRLRALGEETKSKEDIENAVKKLAKLKLTTKNYNDIASRLEILIKERQENEDSEIRK